MKRPTLPALALAAALSLLTASKSSAAVTYVLELTYLSAAGVSAPLGGFTYVSPDFIAGDRVVPATDLASCFTVVVGATCGDQTFRNQPLVDDVIFRVVTPGSLPLALDGAFGPTAFGTVGVHEELGHFGRLIVMQSKDGAVPEPATWTLLIAGFAAVGGALRRRSLAPAAA